MTSRSRWYRYAILRIAPVLLLVLDGTRLAALSAEPPAAAPFLPDPASVERYGPAYRYPQAGWIVLHIEGEPYERGYQHGHLMAPEIAAITRAAATARNPKSPAEGWRGNRLLVDALFLRRYDEEYLLEMKGIADGAAAAGARFDGRPIDLVDIVAVNAWTEIEFLDNALDATAKGIESIRFRDLVPAPEKPAPPSRCSAFIATTPATADGKIVFGHITMWSLYPAPHFNVWLDLQPARGHRVVMQSFAGGIQSSMDYYISDSGLLVAETTLAQTRFNAEGQTEASRIRKALQYADSIDDAVTILTTSNNGLYTNEWLIGDTKTNEIAMFELGTAKSRLYRSSRGEWFGDTPGFYWGCNNTKDLDVRLETVPSLVGKPANVVFRPSDRDLMWQKLYAKHRGKIDGAFGFEAFTTPPLAAAHSLDAKFTTADLAGELKTWALFGPPLGRTWEPTPEQRTTYRDIRPLVSNGWTLLEPAAPARSSDPGRKAAIDLASSKRSDRARGAAGGAGAHDEPGDRDDAALVAAGPAWHGTILPESGGDVWLASAFADYERIVSAQRAARHGNAKRPETLADAAADATALALFPYRCQYLAALHSSPDATLAGVEPRFDSDAWYRLASARGVWLLHGLRGVLGDDRFDDLMDRFGRDSAGKRVTSADFRARAEKAAEKPLDWFFQPWIDTPNTPRLELRDARRSGSDGDWHVTGSIRQASAGIRGTVELCVETDDGLAWENVSIAPGSDSSFELSPSHRPTRIVVDPRQQLLKTNGGPFSVRSFERELEETLIVYGTGPERASLREAAELLQRRIATQWSNYSVPVRSDSEVTDEELGSHHVLLVGRPAVNRLAARLRDALPVAFGPGSFTLLGQTYAHPASALVVAASNPANPRYSLVLFAGLSADATRRIAQSHPANAEVVASFSGSSSRGFVLPAQELQKEFGDSPEHDGASAP